MSELQQFIATPWVLPLLAVLGLLLLWLLYRFLRGRANSLNRVLAVISFDRIENLIIPSADEGEIAIDFLLLTSKGLLILDIKDVKGIVFGGDKMQDWTVIGDERRYTFSNPQSALYDRIAAVRQIVREVPVAGRVLFLPGANFTKGVPGLVCNLEQLAAGFTESDKDSANARIEAFKPHWDQIREQALDPKITGRRGRDFR